LRRKDFELGWRNFQVRELRYFFDVGFSDWHRFRISEFQVRIAGFVSEISNLSSQISGFFQTLNTTGRSSKKCAPQVNICYPRSGVQQVSRDFVIGITVFASAGAGCACNLNPLGIDSQLDQLHERLTEDGVQFKQQLSAHVLKLLFPNGVCDYDNQSVALELNGNSMTAQAFTYCVFPRGQAGGLNDFF